MSVRRRKKVGVRGKTLGGYLGELIDHGFFRNQGAIAAECGTTDAVLSNVLRYPLKRRLSVEQCLRLARKIDAYPSDILKIAGQETVAEILDDLWPRKRDFVATTRGERELLRLWREITTTDRNHLIAMIAMAAKSRVPTVGPVARRAVRKPTLLRAIR